MESNKALFYRGINSKTGKFLVNCLLPSRRLQSVGSIVFLEHLYPVDLRYDHSPLPSGDFAHPHRGIATLNYVLSGSLSHYDSRGYHDIVNAGGLQWMKSGNGIMHDEKPFTREKDRPIFHSLQFWVNLPGIHKKEDPEYAAIQSEDVPEVQLPDHGGIIRILLGEFGVWKSSLPTFNSEFIYHIRLNPNSRFSFLPRQGDEVAAFVPSSEVVINDIVLGNSKMLVLEENVREIVFQNDKISVADIFVFGGKPYKEPIVVEGPFVMNSDAGIADAYKDFFTGAYGCIDYL
ncbi:pirin family protein [Pedobacter sp. HDW13]|uniref:pirin family protein n=1 Tax=Pedobacter sp. HDW13 TaxID=2714940 RepID=UPI00140E5EB7|nr:pirin family protein [Pedobacter sp. HDW13]QIL37919.1 pirin family protein [Pedobacter sp. HDW13]